MRFFHRTQLDPGFSHSQMWEALQILQTCNQNYCIFAGKSLKFSQTYPTGFYMELLFHHRMQLCHDRYLLLKTAPKEVKSVEYSSVQYIDIFRHRQTPDIHITSKIYRSSACP